MEKLKQIKAPCPSFCRKQLTAVLESAPDEGPDRYFCYWRARSVPESRQNPADPPALYGTLDYCPSCGCYLPDFVDLGGDGYHFYGLSKDELLGRITGRVAPDPFT